MRGGGCLAIMLSVCPVMPGMSAPVPLVESHEFRTFDQWDGMSYFAVSGLATTPDGCLWLATFRNLVRFDGVSFDLMGEREAPAFASFHVQVVKADQRGRLWLGGRGEVGVLETNVWRWHGQGEGVPPALVRDIEVLGDGEAWVVTEGGLSRWRNGVFEGVDVPEGARPGEVRLACEVDGTLWCMAPTGLWRREGQSWVRQEPPPAVEGQAFCGMSRARQGGLWVGWADQVWKLRGGSWREPRQRPKESSGDSVVILDDGEGGLWLGGATRGLTWLRPGGGESVAQGGKGLAGNSVTSLVQDSLGNVWVGLNGGYVARVRRRILRQVDADDGLAYAVTSVAEEEPGTIMMGTHGGGLMRWRGGKLEQHPMAGQEVGSGSYITSVCRDRQGSLWVGTMNDGLMHGRDGRWQRVAASETGAQMIRALHEDARGRLWVGTAAGIAVREWGSFRVMDAKDAAPHMVVSGFAEDTGGGLWVCGIGYGLFRWDGLRFGKVELPGNPHPQAIACLASGRDKSLWVGLRRQGVARVKDGKAWVFGSDHGLVVGDSVSLVEDVEGQLWVWTDDRCQRVPVASFDEVEAGVARRLAVRTFTRSDGFRGPARIGMHPVTCRDSEGRLWWATANGLAETLPQTLPMRVVPPGLAWRGIKVGTHPWELASALLPVVDLGRPRGDIEVAFRPDRFGSPETMRYETRLLPRGTWQAAMGQTRIPVQDLVPGAYQLEARASDREGEWGRASSIRFEIPKPLWHQEWFIGLGLASSAGAVVTLARWFAAAQMRRRLRELEQESALERERMRIARNLHDDLGADVTHLGLLLQRLRRAVSASTDAMLQVEEGLVVTRRTKGSLDAAVWAVNPARDTLPDLVSFLAQTVSRLCESAGIEAVLTLPDRPADLQLGAEWRLNVLRVAKEAAHNAVKHSGATEVRLRVVAEDAGLRLEISDNGRGMEPGNGPSPGNGLANMRERVVSVGGAFDIDAAVGTGTTVRAFFPWPPPR